MVGLGPGLSDMPQAVLHGLQVLSGTVALGKSHTALTPTLIVLAPKLAFGVAADVAEGCLDKSALQVPRQNSLKP